MAAFCPQLPFFLTVHLVWRDLGFESRVCGNRGTIFATSMSAESLHHPSRAVRILTDVHFWVPVAVLVAGLLLLKLFP
jgi:hypothetical protein